MSSRYELVSWHTRAVLNSFLIALERQEWKRTGYIWEQYDAQNGEGRRR